MSAYCLLFYAPFTPDPGEKGSLLATDERRNSFPDELSNSRETADDETACHLRLERVDCSPYYILISVLIQV